MYQSEKYSVRIIVTPNKSLVYLQLVDDTRSVTRTRKNILDTLRDLPNSVLAVTNHTYKFSRNRDVRLLLNLVPRRPHVSDLLRKLHLLLLISTEPDTLSVYPTSLHSSNIVINLSSKRSGKNLHLSLLSSSVLMESQRKTHSPILFKVDLPTPYDLSSVPDTTLRLLRNEPHNTREP